MVDEKLEVGKKVKFNVDMLTKNIAVTFLSIICNLKLVTSVHHH